MGRLRTLAVAGITAGVATFGGLVGAAAPAHADTQICDQYGSTTINGGYIVQNNRWGTSSTQCINVTSTGFSITRNDAVNSTSGSPSAYPSVYWGCHYGNCTSGFSPIQANTSRFSSVKTSASLSYPSSGYWDAAYDIWFDPTPRTTGQNTGAEIMVWLNHNGPPQPVGSKVGTVSLAGGTWDVWEGNIGWNVISYVRTSPTSSASFAPATFFNDAVSRGYAQTSWYLTSVQLGFEPWQGGVGLSVNSFSAG
jgi:glycosyl hydrolase family 12